MRGCEALHPQLAKKSNLNKMKRDEPKKLGHEGMLLVFVMSVSGEHEHNDLVVE